MSVVTFLFTDIEGSTPRWEAAPDAMRVALETHNETLQGSRSTRRPRLHYTGDGMCAVFDSPRSAVDAAVAGVQEGAQDVPGRPAPSNRRGHHPRYPAEIPTIGGVAKHSGPQGNSGTAMFARSGTVSSPGALAVSSPERVRRAHRFLIKAASKSVDRAGSRDQAIRIGVTANVGGDLRRSTSRTSRWCSLRQGSDTCACISQTEIVSLSRAFRPFGRWCEFLHLMQLAFFQLPISHIMSGKLFRFHLMNQAYRSPVRPCPVDGNSLESPVHLYVSSFMPAPRWSQIRHSSCSI